MLDRGRYGLGRSNSDEAVEAVERVLESYNSYNHHTTKAVGRVKVYNKRS